MDYGKPPKHGFHKTEIHHHHDGSHTVHHHHMEPEKSISHAVPDLEGVHQSLHDNLGEGAPEAMPQGAPAAAPSPVQ